LYRDQMHKTGCKQPKIFSMVSKIHGLTTWSPKYMGSKMQKLCIWAEMYQNDGLRAISPSQFSPQHTTFTHALEVGTACLAYQRLLVNSYCTFDLYRPRGRDHPADAWMPRPSPPPATRSQKDVVTMGFLCAL